MSTTIATFTASPATGTVQIDVCDECGCLLGARHTCFAVAEREVAEERLIFPNPPRPLTLELTTRDGTTFIIDGVENDTRVSLASLDAVDKAALTVLLQQALREISPPPRMGGGFIPSVLGGVNPHSLRIPTDNADGRV